MPAPIRAMCVENYTAALGGERGRFSFVSYGHAYSVEALPVRGEDGGVEAVLAVATPARASDHVAMSYERMADRLDRSVDLAEQRAAGHLRAGRTGDHDVARREAERVRRVVERSRANARRLRSQDDVAAGAPTLSPRETEVLALISHGLDRQGVAEVLAISPATVKTHVEHVYAKLGVSDRAAAVAVAMRHGLIQ
jgi:DNA-binding NarL/FixJ family response regulator